MGVPKKFSRRKKIHMGVRRKISGSTEKPRISVYKSNKSIYAQVIDDSKGITLFSASSKDVKDGNANQATAKEVGKKLAEKAVDGGVKDAVFDRSGYLYHGQIKALAEGAREGGLKI